MDKSKKDSQESIKNKSARSANPIKSFCYFWLWPKVKSPSPLNHNLPNNANNARISKSQKDSAQNPKLRSVIVGANGLSLGISIVVAILLGIGAGVLMQKIFGVFWVLFLGVAWGIAAAVLNVYKVYKAELRDFEKIADDIKYKANTH